MASEDIDDIEAYLEAQVDGNTGTGTKSTIPSDNTKESNDR